MCWVTVLLVLFFKVAKQKPLGSKIDVQGAKESSDPEFIMYVQRWLDNFPKMTVGN